MTIDTDTLGGRIRLARMRRGLTQKDLSELSGVSNTALSNYEANRGSPSFFNIICVANALNVSLDWLAGREDAVWIDTSSEEAITRLKNCLNQVVLSVTPFVIDCGVDIPWKKQ